MTTLTIPTIKLPGLTLRPPKRADFEPYAAFLASPSACYMSGPNPAKTTWSWFTNDTASWLLCGFGALSIEVNGNYAGQVAITKAPHFPEAELGWFLLDAHTGKGHATAAALALRDWAWANTPLTTLVSYIHPQNAPSIRLAERLGAQPDATAPRPDGETPQDCVVYRHPAPDNDGSAEAYA